MAAFQIGPPAWPHQKSFAASPVNAESGTWFEFASWMVLRSSEGDVEGFGEGSADSAEHIDVVFQTAAAVWDTKTPREVYE